MCKGDEEVRNVDALEAPARKTELGDNLDRGDADIKRYRFLQREDPRLVDKTNDVVDCPWLDGALSGLVPLPGRPIIFLGAAKRIVDGDTVVITFMRHELPIVQCSGHVDSLVARALEDGAGRVAGVHPLERDL